MKNPESLVERVRKAAMAKAKAKWPETSARGARKGDYAQDMRDHLDDYHSSPGSSRYEDDDGPTMPDPDDPGWVDVDRSDDEDRSEGDVAQEDDRREKEPEREGGRGLYVPRFRGGTGTTMSDEQRKLAEDNIREAAQFKQAREASRDEVYAQPRAAFSEVMGSISVNLDSAQRHGITAEQIEKIINETPLEKVEFGYGARGASGGLLFQIVLPTVTGVSGLRTIVGRISDDELHVFHAGETGGGEFTRLEY